jgi:hypothetical protein
MRRDSPRAVPARRYVRVTRQPSVVRTGGGEGHGCLVAERTVPSAVALQSSFQPVITTRAWARLQKTLMFRHWSRMRELNDST